MNFKILAVSLLFPSALYASSKSDSDNSTCGKNSPCKLKVEKVEKIELGCQYQEKLNSPVELPSVYLEQECRILALDPKSKKQYSIYAGSDGCALKVGQSISMNIDKIECGHRTWIFECIKSGSEYQIKDLKDFNIKAKFCNLKQRGWIDQKLIPKDESLSKETPAESMQRIKKKFNLRD